MNSSKTSYSRAIEIVSDRNRCQKCATVIKMFFLSLHFPELGRCQGVSGVPARPPRVRTPRPRRERTRSDVQFTGRSSVLFVGERLWARCCCLVGYNLSRALVPGGFPTHSTLSLVIDLTFSLSFPDRKRTANWKMIGKRKRKEKERQNGTFLVLTDVGW